MKWLLWPGDKVAEMAGLEADSDNRLILRMWANTAIWCAVVLIAALIAM
jgi:hypothetical protein